MSDVIDEAIEVAEENIARAKRRIDRWKLVQENRHWFEAQLEAFEYMRNRLLEIKSRDLARQENHPNREGRDSAYLGIDPRKENVSL